MTIASSVIIPTYKRSEYLNEALQSVIAQKVRFEFEILILDNACDPTLRTSVERIAANSSGDIHYLPVPEIGLHNGRHAGAKAARGQILVFVDDDILADGGWLQAIVDTFDDPAVQLVGGPIQPRYEGDPPEWMEAFWRTTKDGIRWLGYLSLMEFYNEPCEIDPGLIFGANFSIRAETLHRLGGFHPDSVPWELRRFRGDGETAVTRKAKIQKLKTVYQPGALVYHRVPQNRMTLEYFERRAYLEGISKSFSAIRNNGGIWPVGISGFSFDWKVPLRRVKQAVRQFLKLKFPAPPDPYHDFKARVKTAYLAGYEYHQNEVCNDPALLAWVIKPDYWEGKIPQ